LGSARAHPEHEVKKYIEKMEKNERASLIGFRPKRDPIGGVITITSGIAQKVDGYFFAGDPRYEGADESSTVC
jgi:hypothetical protein